MKKAAVFGATGLVGHHLLNRLKKDDEYGHIVVVNRRKMEYSDPKIEELVIDFDHLSDIGPELKVNQIFCCIGTTMAKAGSKEAFRKVDFDIPAAIAILAEKNEVDKLLVMSSIGADSKSSNFYLRTKGEMEEQVENSFSGSLYFFRPSILLGQRKEFRFGELIGKFFVRLLGFLMVGKLEKYRGNHARDVAKAMVYVANHPEENRIVHSRKIRNIAKK